MSNIFYIFVLYKNLLMKINEKKILIYVIITTAILIVALNIYSAHFK